MKILLFADLHMCSRASIINKWGKVYPARLENCINSINWIEELATEHKCDYVINLGDFFDKPDLNSETITACKEIKWSNIPHYSLVGNHDASTSSLIFNSTNSLLGPNHKVISHPQLLPLENCIICFLPYIVECDRKPIKEYLSKIDKTDQPIIILSHNDISGIQLGPVVSRTGFTLDEIEDSCSLFINGHLHNGQKLSSKVINLGNLTGKDFGEDASKYNHNALILDTETLELTFIENPYAYNFYKINIEQENDINLLYSLKKNAVVSIKCSSTLLEKTKKFLSELKNSIVESRIILVKNCDSSSETTELDFTIDHLAKFIECCKTNIEESSLLNEELNEICK